jgi:hypothetical protein
MNTSKIGGPLRGAPALFHPRGSGIPIPEIDADTPFVILNDSEVARDMDDLDGSGGPDAFEVDVTAILAGADKVIVAVGGLGPMVYLLMRAAARPTGYFVVIDTPAARLPDWADLAVKIRNGVKGLAILGPLSAVPATLRDRCAGDPSVEMLLAEEKAQQTLN